MTLADDLTRYVCVPTPIEQIDPGCEIDAGLPYLAVVKDTDGAATVVLTYEYDGETQTFTRPAGALVDQYVMVPTEVDGVTLTSADRQAIAETVVKAPPLSRTQVDLLSRALGPPLREELAKCGEVAA